MLEEATLSGGDYGSEAEAWDLEAQNTCPYCGMVDSLHSAPIPGACQHALGCLVLGWLCLIPAVSFALPALCFGDSHFIFIGLSAACLSGFLVFLNLSHRIKLMQQQCVECGWNAPG